MRVDLQILLWSLAFVGTHLVMSHPPVRTPLVNRLGEWPFRGVYSLVSTMTLVPLVLGWWGNRNAGELLFLARGPVATHGAELLVALGFGLLVAGALSPAPSSMTHRGEVHVEPRGIVSITRHPVNMGIALMSLAHMIVNGWTGDLAFWGAMLALGILGAAHEDHRKRPASDKYDALCRNSTLLPVPTPRALARVGVRGWLGMGLGFGGAVVLRLFHADLFS